MTRSPENVRRLTSLEQLLARRTPAQKRPSVQARLVNPYFIETAETWLRTLINSQIAAGAGAVTSATGTAGASGSSGASSTAPLPPPKTDPPKTSKPSAPSKAKVALDKALAIEPNMWVKTPMRATALLTLTLATLGYGLSATIGFDFCLFLTQFTGGSISAANPLALGINTVLGLFIGVAIGFIASIRGEKQLDKEEAAAKKEIRALFNSNQVEELAKEFVTLTDPQKTEIQDLLGETITNGLKTINDACVIREKNALGKTTDAEFKSMNISDLTALIDSLNKLNSKDNLLSLIQSLQRLSDHAKSYKELEDLIKAVAEAEAKRIEEENKRAEEAKKAAEEAAAAAAKNPSDPKAVGDSAPVYTRDLNGYSAAMLNLSKETDPAKRKALLGEARAIAHDLDVLFLTDTTDPDSGRDRTYLLMPRVGLEHSGKFKDAELLGQGGMADVYMAIDAYAGTPAAIKFNLAQDQGDFEKEARTAQSAQERDTRSRVVKILGSRKNYIVMEYMNPAENWTTLQSCLVHKQRFSPMEVVDIAVALLETLIDIEIHHRDIKPANIFFNTKTRQIKIADFGIAKPIGEGKNTSTGIIKGTVPFMSPLYLYTRGIPSIDGILEEKSQLSLDLYSIGALAYQLLTGGRLPIRQGENGRPFVVVTQPVVKADAPIEEVGASVLLHEFQEFYNSQTPEDRKVAFRQKYALAPTTNNTVLEKEGIAVPHILFPALEQFLAFDPANSFHTLGNAKYTMELVRGALKSVATPKGKRPPALTPADSLAPTLIAQMG
ncbi:MAG: protein kinase, partial [Candidatus Margulisiibacteriota bacterium]